MAKKGLLPPREIRIDIWEQLTSMNISTFYIYILIYHIVHTFIYYILDIHIFMQAFVIYKYTYRQRKKPMILSDNIYAEALANDHISPYNNALWLYLARKKRNKR